MNEGVKVLIERMKTNPEDFQMHPIPQGVKRGRFYWITEEMQKYLNIQAGHYYMTLLKKDDLDALVDAFKDMHQQEFTDKVMKDLFKEEEQIPTPEIAGGWFPQGGRVSTALGQQNAMWSDPRLAMQAQINATSGLTNVSKGGTGTTATTGLLGTLTGIFK
jgi:hypothetical protein